MPKLKSVKVKFEIPYIGGIEGTLEPDESEQNAAWEMYVELITRVSVVELKTDEGLLREALSSLYSLFHTTREILKKYGPSIARPKGKDKLSFGFLSVAVLNGVIRPVLSKWHPLLSDHEQNKEEDVSAIVHERAWDKHEELMRILNNTRMLLIEYSELLAQIADIPTIVKSPLTNSDVSGEIENQSSQSESMSYL